MLNAILIKSLKNKLILSFLLIAVFPAVTISYFYYKTSRDTLERNLIKTSVNELYYIGGMIDKQINFAEQLSDWAFINPDLDRILTRHYVGLHYDTAIDKFHQLMEFQLTNASVGTHVAAFLIGGANGIDLRVGTEAAQIDSAQLQKMDWFRYAMRQHGKKEWYGLVPNPARIHNESQILPLVRPIYHSDISREIGWQMIGFRRSLIADLLQSYEIGPDETLMVVDARGYCIFCEPGGPVGRDLSAVGYLMRIRKQRDGGVLTVRLNGQNRLVSYGKSQLTGWSIVKILSSRELNRQRNLLFRITALILVSSLIFTALLTVFLTANLTRRFNQLLQQTKAIAAGNFARTPLIEGEDELGVLGQGINEMACNIEDLLQQVIRKEQEKRRLELEVLQNQVNPHFLYNTLNSLKVMATIQKADGIREMVTALGRLLMNLSRNQAEKIPLHEEIALLNDYLYIQNIRYKGRIRTEYQLENEACLDYLISKFTLQPIVENAIFHGIEPKKDAGRIQIGIREVDDDLLIYVEDDGAGMTAQQIEKVLRAANGGGEKLRGMSSIGINNVNERIRLVYGSGYGLTIESVLGEYTRVILRLPKELRKED